MKNAGNHDSPHSLPMMVDKAPRVAMEAKVLDIFELKGKEQDKGRGCKDCNCLVIDGRVFESSTMMLLRSGEVVFEGSCTSLKQEKHDAPPRPKDSIFSHHSKTRIFDFEDELFSSGYFPCLMKNPLDFIWIWVFEKKEKRFRDGGPPEMGDIRCYRGLKLPKARSPEKAPHHMA
ncbi:hypothetical protein QQP08_009230 [Theobroma cacao]|nr:hypothetical protein QQP08_009230 [Theobroma cacao]